MTIPELRFKADDGSEFPDWEGKKLGDNVKFINGRAYSQDELLSVGKYQVLRVGNLFTNDTYYYSDMELEPDKYIEDGDLIYAWSATFGPRIYIGNKCIYHYHIWKLKFDENIVSKTFLNYILERDVEKIMSQRTGGTMVHITKSAMENRELFFPSLPEQKKIASFLSTIDDIITITEAELTAWQERKKGVMQKIFNREVRFKADDGSEFPEWEEKTFSEILSENKIPIPKPTNGYERLGIRSHGKGTFHEYVPAGEGLDVDTMYVVEAHNLILNITFAWEQAIAITDNEDDGKLVSHRFPQYKFNDGFDWHYFKYDILDKKLKHELGLASPGGAGRNRVLNKSDFLRIKRVVPCLDEQKKIADCLSSLDDVINQIKAELSAWKEFKKGLLQQMFV